MTENLFFHLKKGPRYKHFLTKGSMINIFLLNFCIFFFRCRLVLENHQIPSNITIYTSIDVNTLFFSPISVIFLSFRLYPLYIVRAHCFQSIYRLRGLSWFGMHIFRIYTLFICFSSCLFTLIFFFVSF